MEEAVRHWNQVGTPPMTLRSPELIAGSPASRQQP
jgi:hypothetical protein